MNLKTWAKGLGVFVLSAFVTSLAAVNISPSTFNFSKAGLVKLGSLVAVIGIKAVLLYLKQSPLTIAGQTITASGVGKSALSLLLCALVITMPVLTSGCRHNVNAAPQVVFANTLLDAADACDLVSTGLLAANDFAEKIQATEPDYYAKLKPWLVRIAKANDKAIAAVRAAQQGDTSANWQGAMAGIAVAAGSEDMTVFGFKNPNSQKDAKIALASLVAALIVIPKSFGGSS